jgi:hypothetical protein
MPFSPFTMSASDEALFFRSRRSALHVSVRYLEKESAPESERLLDPGLLRVHYADVQMDPEPESGRLFLRAFFLLTVIFRKTKSLLMRFLLTAPSKLWDRCPRVASTPTAMSRYVSADESLRNGSLAWRACSRGYQTYHNQE